MTDLIKPTLRTETYLDFHEVIEFVQKKYGFDYRNFAGWTYDGEAPYLDFWHTISSEIFNGAMFHFSRPEIEGEDGEEFCEEYNRKHTLETVKRIKFTYPTKAKEEGFSEYDGWAEQIRFLIWLEFREFSDDKEYLSMMAKW